MTFSILGLLLCFFVGCDDDGWEEGREGGVFVLVEVEEEEEEGNECDDYYFAVYSWTETDGPTC